MKIHYRDFIDTCVCGYGYATYDDLPVGLRHQLLALYLSNHDDPWEIISESDAHANNQSSSLCNELIKSLNQGASHERYKFVDAIIANVEAYLKPRLQVAFEIAHDKTQVKDDDYYVDEQTLDYEGRARDIRNHIAQLKRLA